MDKELNALRKQLLKVNMAEVSRETGLNYWFIQRLRAGKNTNPGRKLLNRLKEYMSGRAA